jgi:hypothetical protein
MKILPVLLLALASAAFGQSCPPSPATLIDHFRTGQGRLPELEAFNKHQTVGDESAHCVVGSVRSQFLANRINAFNQEAKFSIAEDSTFSDQGGARANQRNAGNDSQDSSRKVSRIPADGSVINELVNFTPESHRYYRLQLKHGGQYLDSDHCTTRVALFGLSQYDNGGCQLWRLVPAGDGYYRLQLKHGGQFLDSDHCTTTVALFGRSEYDNGGCQLWRLIPEGNGYYRLQLKHGGQYLDSDHCTTKVALFGRSDYDHGACQLWRFVPEAVPID